MIKSYQIQVRGRVQGVSFRANAKHRAESLNLTGFASNQADGSVLIAAEGEESALRELLEWCRQGSPAASVNKVEYKEINVQNYQGFNVR